MSATHETTKKTITPDEYLRLVGLLTLARDANQQIERIVRSMMAITCETDEGGHTADAAWDLNSNDADRLLEKLGVAVLPAESRTSMPVQG